MRSTERAALTPDFRSQVEPSVLQIQIKVAVAPVITAGGGGSGKSETRPQRETFESGKTFEREFIRVEELSSATQQFAASSQVLVRK